MLNILKRLANKFVLKQYRDAFVEANISSALAHQIELNRKSRGLSQKSLANLIGTKQGVISRYEDSSYGAHSLKTLLRIASAFDTGLTIKFEGFSSLISRAENWTPESAIALGYDEDVKLLASNKNSYVPMMTSTLSEEQSTDAFTTVNNSFSLNMVF